ncbi:MAG: hypothetical protein LBK41_08010 [Clostridiales bacterium]|nr:hypothetical protein [Clostridiales bacterium]
MNDELEPHISGGIVFGFIMGATLPRRNGRAHLQGGGYTAAAQNTLEALFKIVKLSFSAPIDAEKKDSWQTIINKYKRRVFQKESQLSSLR